MKFLSGPAAMLIVITFATAIQSCSDEEQTEGNVQNSNSQAIQNSPTDTTVGDTANVRPNDSNSSTLPNSATVRQPQTATQATEDVQDADAADLIGSASAVLSPASSSDVRGTVDFIQEGDGIRVEANIRGLSPGPHGFHIHETGDCSAVDASTAGGHFNPEEHPHGGPEDDASNRHIGDLGNIEADDEGNASLQSVDNNISFVGDDSIIGRALIVHQQEDDLESQPSGNAGSRVACGVISALAL